MDSVSLPADHQATPIRQLVSVAATSDLDEIREGQQCRARVRPAVLARDLFGLHRIVQRGTSGSEYQLFTLPHGEWIRLLGRCGLMVENMIEVQVPPGAANNDFPELPDDWARRWPGEEVWFARRSSAS